MIITLLETTTCGVFALEHKRRLGEEDVFGLLVEGVHAINHFGLLLHYDARERVQTVHRIPDPLMHGSELIHHCLHWFVGLESQFIAVLVLVVVEAVDIPDQIRHVLHVWQ